MSRPRPSRGRGYIDGGGHDTRLGDMMDQDVLRWAFVALVVGFILGMRYERWRAIWETEAAGDARILAADIERHRDAQWAMYPTLDEFDRTTNTVN